ncbi:ste/ste11/ste11-unclassified protein kinase [Nannizzia gypsea CBS 118893]|uniref:Mitogen-activated protein kinase kinae kinase bck1 n=1 Tax=Arthroderma gypseum (strain ATCC MYA-4604 / CBS 118893) TaxID=535722 RepID=E5R019_ARTGP|nr:ste/ste11/ste11-unclassified protein kinase [Nannizzia gypsea CBS 118893]EFQ98268.1 ste/ste11/ste11-unclassified protein kinase [Nannizzia gypsea CBS 118893]
MDGQRQQYIPGAPMGTLPQGHIPFPPPPPRTQASHGITIPPPPGPPPSSSYALQGMQQNWSRQGMNQQYPPPPPMPVNHAQNQHLAAYQQQRKQGPLSIPPTMSTEEQPLTSATYVPGKWTFGPGVGIPPLVPHESHYQFGGQDPYLSQQQQDFGAFRQQYYKQQQPNEGMAQHHLAQRPYQLSIPQSTQLDSIPTGPTVTTTYIPNPQAAITSSDIQHNNQTFNTANATTSNGVSRNGDAEKWPLDRVLLWLADHGFSQDWQETFKALDLKGSAFLELGSRGNLGKMHQVVYPQLAKECVKSGTGWDHPRERKAGNRMCKLIRQISSTPAPETGGNWHYENTASHSASTDGGIENSPIPNREPMSAVSISHTSENSPGPQFAEVDTSNTAQRQFPSQHMIVPNADTTIIDGSGQDGTLRRKQSPSVSSDIGFPPPTYSDSKSHANSPAAQFASITSSNHHNKRNSSDSTMSRGLSSQGGVAANGPNSSIRTSIGAALGDWRPGHNSSPQEQPKLVNEASHTQGKSLFHIFRKKNNHEIHHQYPDETFDSPTSPGLGVRNNSLFSTSSHIPSTIPDYDKPQAQSWGTPTPSPAKKFVLGTVDGWNFRLIDVSDVDAADSLRALICNSVGIKDPGSALIYLTEPGQIMHEEPLSDTMLVVNRRARSDHLGSLKFFIQSIAMPASAGLGVTFERPLNGYRVPFDMVEDDNSTRVSTARRIPPTERPHNGLSNTSVFPTPNGGQGPTPNFSSDQEKEVLIQRAHEQHLREAERKQKAYLESRKDRIQRTEVTAGNTVVSIKGDRIIDFNVPRTSPYEDKRQDTLIPLRKPPLAPSESNTLTKVNSLSKKPEDLRMRNSKEFQPDFHRQSSSDVKTNSPGIGFGLGAALASVGKMSGVIGTPVGSSTVPNHPSDSIGRPRSSRSDSGARSSGTAPFSEEDGPAKESIRSENGEGNNNNVMRNPTSEWTSQPDQQPAATSESTLPSKPTLQTRKSYGPDFDFQESTVPFAKSPLPQEDSDDDSDSGLFAKPIARPAPPQAKRKPVANSSKAEELKPTLKVNTEPRSVKGRSVAFKSPTTSGASGGNFPASSMFDPAENQNSADADTSNPSTDDREYDRRRESFVRDDIWASRPPVEGMIDHLDDFFPGVDLDEPYLDGNGQSPPMSPSGPSSRDETEPEAADTSAATAQATSTAGYPTTTDLPDVLGSAESTLKAKRVPSTVAHRNLSRSGGLNRMKSIREVAKGAHQVNRHQSIQNKGAAASGILRRKSTKMFGAKIMQISPKPGTRLSDLDPMPQQPSMIQQGKIPQRQPTFRIIRGQLIGKGTYGRVYLGINANTGEILAVKQVEVNQKAANYDKDRVKELVAAMDQEIDTMQHLEHPNIVQYLGCERGDLSISIYLEYIPGGSIGSCLRKHGKFEESVVKSLNRQVLSGLAYLHDQGILHRDLKADNILLDLDGACKISDFGISKKSDNIYGNDVTNSMQGSVFWMAPEVVQSQGQGYSAKVDIWSLGCVVLEMFAGRRPWSKEEAIGAIFKLGSLNQAPPIPEDVALAIEPAALAFMYDCFTIDTFDRPTAETLLSQHPFCTVDPNFNFLDTELHAKIRHVL